MNIILVLLLMIVYASSYSVDDLPHLHNLYCGNCERVYAPVCGSNGRTFTNECRLNCINIKRPKNDKIFIVRYGPCITFRRARIGNLITPNMTVIENVSITNKTLKPEIEAQPKIVHFEDTKDNVATKNPQISLKGLHDQVTRSLSDYGTDYDYVTGKPLNASDDIIDV